MDSILEPGNLTERIVSKLEILDLKPFNEEESLWIEQMAKALSSDCVRE